MWMILDILTTTEHQTAGTGALLITNAACRPEKTPTRKVAKALTAFKDMCFRVFRHQESKQDQVDYDHDGRQDQLAQPLLRDEEQRTSGRLEDIQEVDLEAGQGFSRQQSSRSHAHGAASAAAADRSAAL